MLNFEGADSKYAHELADILEEKVEEFGSQLALSRYLNVSVGTINLAVHRKVIYGSLVKKVRKKEWIGPKRIRHRAEIRTNNIDLALRQLEKYYGHQYEFILVPKF